MDEIVVIENEISTIEVITVAEQGPPGVVDYFSNVFKSGVGSEIHALLTAANVPTTYVDLVSLNIENADHINKGLMSAEDKVSFDDVPSVYATITNLLAEASFRSTADSLLIPLTYIDTDVTLSSNSNTRISSQSAIKSYVDSLVVGLLNDRGSYDASINTYPVVGGSGSSGAVRKGDLWYISVAGVLGSVAVNIGDSVRALINTPGQLASNWSVLESNIGFVPESIINKALNFSVLNNTLYPTTQAVANSYQPLSLILSTFAGLSNGSGYIHNNGSGVLVYQDIDLTGYTPTSRTINGHSLSSNVIITASDLSLVIGTNVQAWDLDLDTFASLIPSNDDILQRKSGVWVNRTLAQLKTDLLLSGTNTGDQTISLTGGITGSGTGSFAATVITNANLTGHVTSIGNATTIASGVVTNAMLAGLIDLTSKIIGILPTANGGTGIAYFTATGPTQTRVYTFPDAAATIARTDAANTFTGHQTIEGVTSTGATGTGNLVFGTSPTLLTPTLGVASATSINKWAFTTPTTAATLTAGANNCTYTFPASSATIARTDAANAFVGNQTIGVGQTTSAQTDLLINPTTKASGNLIDLQVNGSSKFLIAFDGSLTLPTGGTNFTISNTGAVVGSSFTAGSGSVGAAAGSFFVWSSRSLMTSPANGQITLQNNAQTGFTRLQFGLSTNSAPAIGSDAVNGFTLQSAAGTATWNNASTANSGTVAIRYLFGIAAPTLTSTGTSVTNTIASTFYIGGAPSDSTNTTSTTKMALYIPGAPVASANGGLVSLGSGAWDGSTSGFFAGSSNGTVLAVNSASGFTGNLVNFQANGTWTFRILAKSVGSIASIIDINMGSSGGDGFNIYRQGTQMWNFDGSTGHLWPASDNARDIGQTGLRLKSGYFGTSLLQGGALNIGSTSTDGIVIQNTTAAAAGVQQWSPRLRFTAQGWKTTSTAGSQTVDWIIENQPVQGAANPTSNLVISSQVNAANYSAQLTLNSGSGLFVGLGTSAIVSLGIGLANTGFYSTSSGNAIDWSINGTRQGQFNGASFSLLSDTAKILIGASSDLILTRSAAATLHFGAADAASPVAQFVGVQGVVAGTSNTAGSLWTFRDSMGTGTGASGGYAWQTGASGSTGTTQNTWTTKMSLDSTGNFTATGVHKLGSFTVATLPAAASWTGGLAFVTDSTTTIITGLGLAVVGSGSNKVVVYSDGVNWLVL